MSKLVISILILLLLASITTVRVLDGDRSLAHEELGYWLGNTISKNPDYPEVHNLSISIYGLNEHIFALTLGINPLMVDIDFWKFKEPRNGQ